MSGFKSWNNSNDSSSSSGGSGGGGGGFGTNQWGETPTTLLTNKNIYTSAAGFSDNGWYRISDLKFKSNIKNLSENKTEYLDKLKRLIPKSYNFKDEKDTSFGLIAQEVEKIYPTLVATKEDGTKSVNYTEIIPLLLLQTNEMERKIEELKNNN